MRCPRRKEHTSKALRAPRSFRDLPILNPKTNFRIEERHARTYNALLLFCKRQTQSSATRTKVTHQTKSETSLGYDLGYDPGTQMASNNGTQDDPKMAPKNSERTRNQKILFGYGATLPLRR